MNLKILFSIAALLLFIGLLALFTLPVSTKLFEISDRCGNVGGFIMNSIEEASTCSSQCMSQCAAEGYKKSDSAFEKGGVCNKCTCYCKNTIL